ncbi:NADH-quinone oxidoreductase subunit L [Caminibacter pacificus]|uniref:NADH dehydrogenase subunit L n=1 Tax=Caminibacter pacificus TaxID=1424653 RepID=A0AAJ4UXM9_9BACT|nr:NADH-quinone oxidoreductase subunit L [Caminibacter pacificus]NPA88306.1 NADH-quinone oxidoreductase subunit L [Campylobacterota bacterium]QCI28865.1 NADH-quinone oxidoreductase subunit L [Caminibacter pacificus]ROR39456.1 NADH dehydrogenase subunit L [Caminibacter pacificus]
MNNAVLILLTAPFLGAVLAYVLGKAKRELSFWVAEVTGAILFLASLVLFFNYSHTVIDIDYTWIAYGDLKVPFGIYIDHLSIVMLLVATGLGFLDIHFAHDYMGEDPDQPRYYAKVLFFIGGMIILVITKDLIGAFVGWEFMGLASYLLISFWYYKNSAADAGMQAFLYTRFGDIFILAAIALLFFFAGTVDLVKLNEMALSGELNKTVALVAALFIFMGAIGKSGQFPLYPWLMNAMEGPTTVSALIHGATMVNSGIYIVARLFDFFAYTDALFIVANVAALSAFIGATSALVQKEIKKILAYSTMSHLSIAFVGLGVGSLAAGMLHLVNHAIFKALLFLSAGAVIYIAHHTKDAWKLGGLIKTAPLVALFMAMGSLSLAGVPPFSGFFSKELVVASAWEWGNGFTKTFVTIAALLSIGYITRLWILIFLGEPRNEEIAGSVHKPSNLWIRLPLGILAFVTLFIAIWQSDIIHYIVGKEVVEPHVAGLTAFMLTGMLVIFLIVVGLYVKGLNLLYKIASHHFVQTIHQVLFNGYYVEAMITWISKNIIVNAIAKAARWFDTYVIDWLVNATVPASYGIYKAFKTGHSGKIGTYMGQFVLGVAIIVIAILIIVKGL